MATRTKPSPRKKALGATRKTVAKVNPCPVIKRAKPKGKPKNGSRYSVTPKEYKNAYDRKAYLMLRIGAYQVDVAAMIDCAESTIEQWIRDEPSFAAAIQDGTDDWHTSQIEGSLRSAALGVKYEEVTTREIVIKTPGKDAEGNPLTIETPAMERKVVHKTIQPNITAIIFWLVNRSRKSERWMNTQSVKVEGQLDNTHNHFFHSVKELAKDCSKDELKTLHQVLARQDAETSHN